MPTIGGMRGDDGRDAGRDPEIATGPRIAGWFSRHGKVLGMLLSAGLLAGLFGTMRLAGDGHAQGKFGVATLVDGAEAPLNDSIVRGVTAESNAIFAGEEFRIWVRVDFVCPIQNNVQLAVYVDPAVEGVSGATKAAPGVFIADLICSGGREWSESFGVKVERNVGWSGAGNLAFHIYSGNPLAPVSLAVTLKDAEFGTLRGSAASAPSAAEARWDATGGLRAEARFVDHGPARRANIVEAVTLLLLGAQLGAVVSYLRAARRRKEAAPDPGFVEPPVDHAPLSGASPAAIVGYGAQRSGDDVVQAPLSSGN